MSYFSMKSITLIPLLTHSRPFEKRIFPFSIASRTIFSQEESFWISLETKIDIHHFNFSIPGLECVERVSDKSKHTLSSIGKILEELLILTEWERPFLTKLRLNSTILVSIHVFIRGIHTHTHTQTHNHNSHSRWRSA